MYSSFSILYIQYPYALSIHFPSILDFHPPLTPLPLLSTPFILSTLYPPFIGSFALFLFSLSSITSLFAHHCLSCFPYSLTSIFLLSLKFRLCIFLSLALLFSLSFLLLRLLFTGLHYYFQYCLTNFSYSHLSFGYRFQ